MPDPRLLTRLAQRAEEALADEPAARQFLAHICPDEKGWSVLRVGACSAALLEGWEPQDRAALKEFGLVPERYPSPLAGNGILLPTFDPQAPQEVVGLVKIHFHERRHQFLTSPRGLACAQDIGRQPRIVLTSSPTLALHLAGLRVQGIALAQTPKVLTPLREWLGRRDLVAVAYKQACLQALVQALGPTGRRARTLLMHVNLAHSPPASLETLGIAQAVREAAPRPSPFSPKLIRELAEFAQARLAAGHGRQLLEAFEADSPEFIAAYGLGFLPGDFAKVLSKEAELALRIKRTGRSLLVPAFDTDGTAVDALLFGPKPCPPCGQNLLDAPAGLIAPKIVTAFREVLVTDSLLLAGRNFKRGRQNVLLLRGAADAQANAMRLLVGGVRSVKVACRRAGQRIAAALRAVGLDVTVVAFAAALEETEVPQGDAAPATPEPKPGEEDTPADAGKRPAPAPASAFPAKPELEAHDTRAMRAKFKAGEASYEAETAWDAGSLLEIKLIRQEAVHLDRFDLSKEAQRRRFAESAAMKTGVPCEVVEAHLIHILEAVRGLREQLSQPEGHRALLVEVPAAEREEALALLRRPDLLDVVAADLEALGWVGEDRHKRLIYLAAISRKLPKPLSVARRAPAGAGKSFGIETLCELVPPEDLTHVSRLTDSALYYQSDALRHKLLVIDEADSLTPEVMVALRVLQSRGALSHSLVQRDAATGQSITQFSEIRGPVAVLTSTTKVLEEQILSRCFDLAVDDSPEQTQRILKEQRRLRADPARLKDGPRREALIRRHHAMQRLLETRPILIPFADRIEFPASSLRHRREQERFLNLIEASALLHQYQRLKDGEFVLAEERDYAIALNLAQEHVAGAGDELTAKARAILDLLQEQGLAWFDINQLKAFKPHWTRHAFRAGLEELLRQEAIASPLPRRRPKQYNVLECSVESLRLAGRIGELAKMGEGSSANTPPESARG